MFWWGEIFRVTHIVPSRGVILLLVVINEGGEDPKSVVLVAECRRPDPAADS